MTTTLTAVPFPSTSSVRLRVEAHEAGYAPVLWLDYSDFNHPQIETEYELWDVSAGVTTETPFYGGWLLFHVPPDTAGVRVARTVSGLEVGQTYRLLLGAHPLFAGALAAAPAWTVGIEGVATRRHYDNLAGGSSSSFYGGGDPGATTLVVEFVATDTEHEVVFTVDTSDAFDYTLEVYAIGVQHVPSPRTVLESNMLAPDDTLWSFTGALPSGVTRAAVVDTWPAGARSYGFELDNGSGAGVNVPADSQAAEIDLDGLTPGDVYTARVYFESTRAPNGLQHARWRVDVVGLAASDPVTGSWVAVRFTATASSHVLRVAIADTMTLEDGQRLGVQVHYVRLDAEYDGQDAYRLVSLTRSDANGSRPVRLFEDADLIDGLLVVEDYEAALTGLIRYDVQTAHVPSGVFERANASATFDGLEPRPGYRLAPAPFPQQTLTLDLVTLYGATRDVASTVHDVIGRADRVVTLGVQRSRSGRLEVWCSSYQDALAVVRLFGTGETLLWRQPDYPGMDMYFTVTTSDEQPARYGVPAGIDRWLVACDYVEQPAPTAPLMGSVGWTIAASSARNPTFAAAQLEFPTVLALLIGPVA